MGDCCWPVVQAQGLPALSVPTQSSPAASAAEQEAEQSKKSVRLLLGIWPELLCLGCFTYHMSMVCLLKHPAAATAVNAAVESLLLRWWCEGWPG
jgi:hypothetical protein